MAPVLQRPVQQWEQMGSTVNISMYLELHGHGITGETLTRAFKDLQTEHPFLRLGIDYLDNVATFVELADPVLSLTTTAGLHPKWQTRLQDLANEFKDFSEGVFSAELASSDQQHQLFLTINHASTCGT